MRCFLYVLLAGCLLVAPNGCSNSQDATETQALRVELQELSARVATIQRRLDTTFPEEPKKIRPDLAAIDQEIDALDRNEDALHDLKREVARLRALNPRAFLDLANEIGPDTTVAMVVSYLGDSFEKVLPAGRRTTWSIGDEALVVEFRSGRVYHMLPRVATEYPAFTTLVDSNGLSEKIKTGMTEHDVIRKLEEPYYCSEEWESCLLWRNADGQMSVTFNDNNAIGYPYKLRTGNCRGGSWGLCPGYGFPWR